METKIEYYEDGSIKMVYAVDENGVMQGPCETYYKNGQLKRKWNYTNGEPEGQVEGYSETGKLLDKFTYKYNMELGHSEKDGYCEFYREGHFIKATYIDGKINGFYEERDEGGRVVKKGNYKDDKMIDGIQCSYDWETECLREKITYKDGQPNGPYEIYDENGHLKEKGTAKNGIKEGPYEQYEPGYSCEKGTYRNGFKEGPYERYTLVNEQSPKNRHSVLSGKGTYENGKEVGAYETYFRNGHLKEKGNLENGEHKGPYESYYFNGQLKIKTTYKGGRIDGPYEEYEEDGRLHIKGIYKNDILWEGIYQSYYAPADGSGLARIEHYKNGEMHGDYESYHPNGQLKIKCVYQNGVKEGPYEEFCEDGSLAKRGVCKNGKLVEPEDKKERRGLNARLKELNKIQSGVLKRASKRSEVAKFRKKFPDKTAGK